ncbi:hypothetical protein HDU87_001566, partial [Geranomyces variabilis]
LVKDRTVDIEYVATEDQLADVLTKPLPRPAFADLIARLRIKDVKGKGSPGWHTDPDVLGPLVGTDRAKLRELQEASTRVWNSVQQARRDEQDRYERYFNAGRQAVAFIGDRVDLNREQLDAAKPRGPLPKWIGPFIISAKGPHWNRCGLKLV